MMARLAVMAVLVIWLWATSATPAHADPITTAVVSFFSLTGTAAAVASFVVRSAIYSFASWGMSRISRALSRGRDGAQERQATVTTLSLGETPREAVFGRAVTGGSLIDAFNFGGEHGTDTVVRVIALADHEITQLEGIFVDDAYQGFGFSGVQLGFNGKLDIEFVNAGAAGGVPPVRFASAGGWTAADKLVGVAHVWVATTIDEETWTGHPAFRFLVKGAKLYDPAKDAALGYEGPNPHVWSDPATHEFTENAAVIEYNYRRGIYVTGRHGQPQHLLLGRGLTAEEAPAEAALPWIALCDELVGGEPRYRAAGVVTTADGHDAVAQWLADAMAGQVVQREGGIEVEPGHAKAPVMTITDGDLVVGEKVVFNAFSPDGSSGRYNTIIPRYVEPTQGWQDHSGPVRRDLDDIAEDGGPRELTLPLPMVTWGAQADRCAEIRRRRERLEKTATIVLPPRFAALEEGDWINWQSDRRHGGETVTYQIEEVELGPNWRQYLVLREISAEVFDDGDGLDDDADPLTPTPQPDAVYLTGVEVFAQLLDAAETGARQPGLMFTWSTPVDAAIRSIRAEVRLGESGAISPTTTEDVNSGALIVTNGVLSNAWMQARLVPATGTARAALSTAWATVRLGQGVTERLFEQGDLATRDNVEWDTPTLVGVPLPLTDGRVGLGLRPDGTIDLPIPADVIVDSSLAVQADLDALGDALLDDVELAEARLQARVTDARARLYAEAARAKAAVIAETNVRQTAVANEIARIDALLVRMGDAEDGIEDAEALILALDTVTTALGDAIDAIDDELVDLGAEISAVATALDLLSAEVGENTAEIAAVQQVVATDRAVGIYQSQRAAARIARGFVTARSETLIRLTETAALYTALDAVEVGLSDDLSTLAGVVASQTTLIADLDADKVEITDFNTFSASVTGRLDDAEDAIEGVGDALDGVDGRLITAEGTISTHTSLITGLDIDLTDLGTDVGLIALDVTALEDALEDVESATSAIATEVEGIQVAVTSAEGRLDDAEDALDDLDDRQTLSEAGLTTITQAAATAAAAGIYRQQVAAARTARSAASVQSETIGRVTATSALAALITALEAVVDDVEADLTITAGAVVDLLAQVQTAFFEVVAAAGGDPARLLVRADAEGSLIALVATHLILGTADGETITEVLKLIGDDAYFADRIYAGDGVYIDPTDRVLVFDDGTTKTVYGHSFGVSGALRQWSGPSSIALADMTPANGVWSMLRSDGSPRLRGMGLLRRTGGDWEYTGALDAPSPAYVDAGDDAVVDYVDAGLSDAADYADGVVGEVVDDIETGAIVPGAVTTLQDALEDGTVRPQTLAQGATVKLSPALATAVQPQSYTIKAGDGETVAFGTTYPFAPVVLPISLDNLLLGDATAGDSFFTEPVDVTPTGFTGRARRKNPGAGGTSVLRTDDGTGNGTATPGADHIVAFRNKALSGVAANGQYDFAVTVVTKSPPSLNPRTMVVGVFGRKVSGGTWTQLGQKSIQSSSETTDSESSTHTIVGSSEWSDWNTITGSGNDGYEYKAEVISGYISGVMYLSDFQSVQYTEVTGASGAVDVTALPSGGKLTYLVIPQASGSVEAPE